LLCLLLYHYCITNFLNFEYYTQISLSKLFLKILFVESLYHCGLCVWSNYKLYTFLFRVLEEEFLKAFKNIFFLLEFWMKTTVQKIGWKFCCHSTWMNVGWLNTYLQVQPITRNNCGDTGPIPFYTLLLKFSGKIILTILVLEPVKFFSQYNYISFVL
jgi:hypothetical protein